MDFKHFVAADGWFYKVVPHKDVIEAGGRPVIHRVAVWALTADGNIIGLTAATSTAPRDGSVATVCDAPRRRVLLSPVRSRGPATLRGSGVVSDR